MFQKINVEKRGEMYIASFKGQELIAEDVIESSGKELAELVDEVGVNKVIIDFSGIDCLASLMVTQLRMLHKLCEAKGVKLVISRSVSKYL